MHGKIYVPARLLTQLLMWYYKMLYYPGQTRLGNTIWQHFTWPKLSTDVQNIYSNCHVCKIYKNYNSKYGLLPPKDIEDEYLWHTLYVDLISPYKITDKSSIEHTLHAITMIDAASSWFEVIEIKNKIAKHIGIILDCVWFSRYPRPVQRIYDNGNKFLGKDF